MSGTTTELALQTAVDSDDNADYLTLALANSLRTIDALFNNVTGHTHGAAHQGGPIIIGANQIADGSITSAKIADGSIATIDLADASVTSAKLSPPIDIAGYFRSTAFPAAPSAGAGLELYYISGPGGTVQAYDRGAAAYRPLSVLGSAVNLTASGQTMTLDSLGHLNAPSSISVNTSRGTNAGSINLLAAAAGSDVNVFAENGNLYAWMSNASGQLLLQGASGSGWRGITCGPVAVQGNLSATNVSLPDSGLVTWVDGNTRIYSQSRGMYFDTYNAGFNFRNSAASFATQMSIDSAGNVTAGGRFQFANNPGIYIFWDSTGISHSHQVRGPGAYFTTDVTLNPGHLRLNQDNRVYWGSYSLWYDSNGRLNFSQGGPGIANGASGGSVSPPTTVRGFLQVAIEGVGTCKIPIYNN
jgi:hypothetical protein